MTMKIDGKKKRKVGSEDVNVCKVKDEREKDRDGKGWEEGKNDRR